MKSLFVLMLGILIPTQASAEEKEFTCPPVGEYQMSTEVGGIRFKHTVELKEFKVAHILDKKHGPYFTCRYAEPHYLIMGAVPKKYKFRSCHFEDKSWDQKCYRDTVAECKFKCSLR